MLWPFKLSRALPSVLEKQTVISCISAQFVPPPASGLFTISKVLSRKKAEIRTGVRLRSDWSCEGFLTLMPCVDWRFSSGRHPADRCGPDGRWKWNVFTVRRGREHDAREPQRSGVWLMLSRNLKSLRIQFKSILAAFCQPLPSIFTCACSLLSQPSVPDLLWVHWKSPLWRARANHHHEIF